MPVVFDSGVRSGDHIVRALARGATAVAADRPYACGLALGGDDGIVHVLRSLLAEADLLMTIDGYPTVADLSPDAPQARAWTMRSKRRPGIRLTTRRGLPDGIRRNRRPPPRRRQPGMMDDQPGRGLRAWLTRRGRSQMVAHWLASFSNGARREGRPPRMTPDASSLRALKRMGAITSCRSIYRPPCAVYGGQGRVIMLRTAQEIHR